MRIFLRALALWLATVACASAGWRVVSSERVNLPNEPVEHRLTKVENDATDDHATLHFAIFQPRNATLRIIDQPVAPRRDLAEVMNEKQALAGVNGGYFDPEDRPVGLLVSGGKKIMPLSSAHLLSGVLFASGNRVEIVRSRRFELIGKMKEAVQCGPLLLEHGKPVAGLNHTRSARRTFAAVNETGRTAALGYCSGVSLADLGEILSLTNIAGESKFARALNLDGGSSSAFWCRGADRAFSISEQKTVRDFVAILPRSDR
ncbi:MAG: phosphodiester glycosidase family protein [Chthoniobacterales bacterium]